MQCVHGCLGAPAWVKKNDFRLSKMRRNGYFFDAGDA
jgi:hypothetical protein